jgi:pyruvate/2-oxoacid:ferredoxin oxidoreductase beta subunit
MQTEELKERQDIASWGVSTCQGCGLENAFRTVVNVLGPKTVVVIPPGCSATFSGVGAETCVQIPGYQCNLENAAASAAGIRAGLDMLGRTDVNVLAWAGDGATIDIGLQALSGVMERGDRIIYCCYDNEAYMNTGIQASGSTPFAGVTTTTPGGKPTYRKDFMQIVAAHRIPYAATCSIAYVEDMKKKVERAMTCGGTAFLYILAPCPTGWFYGSEQTIELARLAVQTSSWPLYEIVNGTEYRVTQKISRPKPVSDYMKPQGRFSKMTEEEMSIFQQRVDKDYALLLKRAEA